MPKTSRERLFKTKQPTEGLGNSVLERLNRYLDWAFALLWVLASLIMLTNLVGSLWEFLFVLSGSEIQNGDWNYLWAATQLVRILVFGRFYFDNFFVRYSKRLLPLPRFVKQTEGQPFIVLVFFLEVMLVVAAMTGLAGTVRLIMPSGVPESRVGEIAFLDALGIVYLVSKVTEWYVRKRRLRKPNVQTPSTRDIAQPSRAYDQACDKLSRLSTEEKSKLAEYIYRERTTSQVSLYSIVRFVFLVFLSALGMAILQELFERL